eukprot:TRINITY_DN40008_c0_g1_i1.p1 TRINITY_DN40008_c0_g1~~TRINITY_DN40008_c0_g1_i1.p1  ORF type:complete len:482 (-),score=85.12 TRINITY_DN40008_c0_g1_i1:130-1575(-)
MMRSASAAFQPWPGRSPPLALQPQLVRPAATYAASDRQVVLSLPFPLQSREVQVRRPAAQTVAQSVSNAPESKPSVLPVAKASEPVLLGPGKVVSIGGFDFHISELLGKGSFGTVWSAMAGHRSQAGLATLAVKELLCKTEEEVQRAVLEGHFLQALRAEAAESPGRVPTLEAIEVVRDAEKNVWLVRTAMTQLPGRPLEQKLEQRRTAGNLSDSHAIRRGWAEACCCAGQLLAQLAPTLENMSERLYHRDITPRNILVTEEGSAFSFGLVDFGLAVDAKQWRYGVPSFDVGGDGRYWPVSAWFAFEHGTEALEQCPDLQHEYRTCIDVHGLGTSALRCLMELSPSLENDVCATAFPVAAHRKLKDLKESWADYWDYVTRSWQPVYEIFCRDGCSSSLQTEFRKAGVHQKVGSSLNALRNTLREARQACESATPESGLAGMPALFDALLLMIQPGLGVQSQCRMTSMGWAAQEAVRPVICH